MAGLCWSMSVVMQQHLQNLVSLGYMTAVELATCRVAEDPTSPVPAGDTSWLVRCSMSKDSGCPPTDFYGLICIT
jgi:hypothetical protein